MDKLRQWMGKSLLTKLLVGGTGTIFVLGLLLGVIRARTDSLYPTLVFHGAINLLAVTQTAILH